METLSRRSARVSVARMAGALRSYVLLGIFAGMTASALAQSISLPNAQSQQPDGGFDTGDPIAANAGAYHFTKPLLDLGGPLPLRYSVNYRLNRFFPRGAMHTGFRDNHDGIMEWGLKGSGADTKRVCGAELGNLDWPYFSFDTNTATWVQDPGTPAHFELVWPGAFTNGLACLFDKRREVLHVFSNDYVIANGGEAVYGEAVPLCIVDRNYNRHTYTYTNVVLNWVERALRTRIDDGLGRVLEFSYTNFVEGAVTNIFLHSVADQGGRRVLLGYDTNAVDYGGGTVCRSITDACGHATTLLYTNASGARGIRALQKPLGNVPYSQTLTRTKLNGATRTRVFSQYDARGHAVTFGYDAATNRVTETRPDGAIVTYEHHHNQGPPRSMTDSAGNTTHFGLSTNARISEATDRMGDATRVTYHEPTGKIATYCDTGGALYSNAYAAVDQVFTNPVNAEVLTNRFYDLVRRDYPDGTFETLHYDGRGNPTARVDRAGHLWRTTYNEHGQRLQTVNPEGGTVTYTYNSDGTPASVTDSDTAPDAYVYVVYKRPARVDRPDGKSVGMGYDLCNRVTALTNTAGRVTTHDYDANGNLVSVTDPSGHDLSLLYDAMDRLTNRSDTIGPIESSAYDTLSRLASVVDAGGNVTSNAYDPRGWVTNRTRNGRTWVTAYDEEGVPVSRATPLGHRTTYRTDTLGMVTGVVDALNQAYAYERDLLGRVVSAEDPMGHARTYTYDGLGKRQTISVPVIGTVSYVRNGLGLPTAYTNFNGWTWRYGYTPMGRLAAVTNPLGHATQHSYDPQLGRRIRTDHPDGTHVEFTHDSEGRVRTLRDPAGFVRTYEYDHAGRLLSATNPSGGVASYTYHPDGKLATTTEAGLGVTSNSYDALRRLERTTFSDGATVAFLYDGFDRITNAVDANGGARRYEYDAGGRLLRETDPLANARSYTYDALNRMTNMTDTLGHVYLYEYDAIGRLTRSTDPEGISLEHAYDAADRRIATTRGGQTWRYGYDDEGALTSETTPLGHTMTYVRDALGFAVGITDAMGNIVTKERDAMERVTAEIDGLGRTNSFAYDARGLPTAVSNALSGATYEHSELGLLEKVVDPNREEWTFAYTKMGRLEERTDPLSRSSTQTWDERGRLAGIAFADGQSVDLAYDGVGNVTNRTYSDGMRIDYEYDGLNRLVTCGGTTPGLSLAYDPEGRVTATDNPGTVSGATYDRAGRLKTATYSNGLFTVRYSYDPVSALLTRVEDDLTGTVVGFRYDADRRLARITRPNGVHTTYTLDGAGRLLRIRAGAVLDLRYELDAAGQVVGARIKAPLTAAALVASGAENHVFDAASQVGTAGHAHDARGRLTAAPGRTYTWNDAGHLTGMSGPSGTSDLSYNGLGDQVTRTRGGAMTHFYYNHAIGTKPIVAERDDTAGQMRRYYVWSPSGRLLYMIDALDGNKVYHYHFDHAGSTLALTDAAGVVADAYAYTPVGRLAGHSGSSDQPFMYAGELGVRREGADGLYHMRMRYYNAASGRFLSRDSVWPLPSNVRSLNPYQYALLNPVKFGDPQGTCALDWTKLLGDGSNGEAGNYWNSNRETGAGAAAPEENTLVQLNERWGDFSDALNTAAGIVDYAVPGAADVVGTATEAAKGYMYAVNMVTLNSAENAKLTADETTARLHMKLSGEQHPAANAQDVQTDMKSEDLGTLISSAAGRIIGSAAYDDVSTAVTTAANEAVRVANSVADVVSTRWNDVMDLIKSPDGGKAWQSQIDRDMKPVNPMEYRGKPQGTYGSSYGLGGVTVTQSGAPLAH
jgi:RHS repeat-associated protein